MNEWKVKDVDSGKVWHKDSKKECEEAIEDFGHAKNLEIVPPEGQEAAHVTEDNAVVQQGGQTDGGTVEMVEGNQPPEPVESDLPEQTPDIDQDPVDWLPSHFIDDIQGVPTVNRKGYAVIAAKYNVSVKAEPVTLASATDFEYAEFKAVAITDDGQEYSGFGSAHIDRMDGDDPHLLNELAETRAMKRATAWSTGVGLTAATEMMNEL
jgi:hypothetical protein